jgi:DNA-binding response OmpR family regulator
MAQPEILVIDDLTESVALLLRYFEDEPMDVMVALGGGDGLRKARAGQPDLILLDVSMPHMDGYAVCRELKADPRTAHIPVIFLSANTSLQNKLEGFAAGGVDYIGKPFSSEEVMARVSVHLHGQRFGRPSPMGAPLPLPAPASGAVDRRQLQIASALQHMAAASYEAVSLDKLASKVGVNTRRLTEIFRQQFGMTVAEYQLSQKMELAREKLCNTGLQIQLIAEQAGYLNASDFSRAFRQRYGLGPREYCQVSRGALPDGTAND